ncbi:MAG TPA: DNA polymerase Y family protein, partial [Rhodospirillales bacterium]|nr:DNA polymerase Y family protein [Rhodospirillales bacterium]
MRRVASLWFPYWPTDARRWRRRRAGTGDAVQDRQEGQPFALAERTSGGMRLTAVDAAAAAEGLCPGMTLADARAALPHLAVAEAEPAADTESLGRLADWCGRWTPWAATDGADGIALDVGGGTHLFGGEAALLREIRQRLQRLGFAVRVALADTPAAAWAWARYGDGGVLAKGAQAAALAPLPVAALRLPAVLVRDLERLGLATIAALAAVPRAPLARRFGNAPLRRLDQALGRLAEPIGPRPPPADWMRRRSFAEPIGRAEDVAAGLRLLLRDLTADLAAAGRGARRLALTAYRIDGSTGRCSIGTARPSRAVEHLARLFAEPLTGLDPGFGIEALALAAEVTEPLAAHQLDWQCRTAEPDALVLLIDRLQQRLGSGGVARFAPVESHLPERAVGLVPALAPPARGGWPLPPVPRPLRLLPAPEPIAVTAPVPDGPPVAFRWRRVQRRVVGAEGPERIAAEWWREAADMPARDYYR